MQHKPGNTCTGTSTQFTFADMCVIGLRSVQHSYFKAQLKTDTLNLIIIKTEPNVFSMEDSFHLAGAESPVLYRKRFCVSLQDHCYKTGLGLSC